MDTCYENTLRAKLREIAARARRGLTTAADGDALDEIERRLAPETAHQVWRLEGQRA